MYLIAGLYLTKSNYDSANQHTTSISVGSVERGGREIQGLRVETRNARSPGMTAFGYRDLARSYKFQVHDCIIVCLPVDLGPKSDSTTVHRSTENYLVTWTSKSPRLLGLGMAVLSFILIDR